MASGDNTVSGNDGLLTEGFLSSGFLSKLGAGILAANRGGMPLGAAVGHGLLQANRGQQEALKNQAIRDQLTNQKRKREAQQKLAETLKGQGQDPELVGLLAQAAPEQLAQGLIGQLFPQATRPNSTLQLLNAAGIDPESAEGQEIIRRKLLKDGSGMDQIDAVLKGLQIQKLQGDLTTAKTDKDRTRIRARQSVIRGTDHILEAIQINERLRGTLGESGIGLNDLRAGMGPLVAQLTETFGGDAARARQVAVDIQRFRQLTTGQALKDLFSGELNAGTITNNKLGVVMTTKPGFDQLPETNASIFADMLQAKLDSAEQLDVVLPDEEQIRAEIKRLRGSTKATDTPPAAAPTPAPTGAPKNNRSDLPDRELFKRFAEKHPRFGPVSEANIRATMRETGETRKEVITRMRKMVEGN